MPVPFRRSAIAAGLLIAQAVVVRAQTTTGAIQGFVHDSAGHPVEEVEFRLFEGSAEPRLATSDSAGRFYFRGAVQGELRLSVRRVGYLQQTLTVKVVPRETSRIDVIMAAGVSLLPEEIIHAAPDPTRGKMGPFNRRKARGVGSFITRADIEKRQPGSISELLRTLPGVNVSQRMAGEPQPVHMQRSVNSSMQSTCVVQIYVDGQPYPNGNLDDFAPLTLEGVEVYRSASEIPADFRTRDATCGLIALWTRDPEAARRKP